MNFNDEFTRDLEDKFQKNLKAIREMPPEAHEQIKQNLLVITWFLEELNNHPDKTPEDLELLASFNLQLKEILQQMEDMKLILGESLHRQSRAYFEHVKKLAKEGDREAENIYNDLKKDFEKFDPN